MRKLVKASSSRRDPKVYLLLLAGAVFLYAGLTVNPADNCGLNGRQCAPWLVPLAYVIGTVLTGLALAMLVHARNWGSRLDLDAGMLSWWDSDLQPAERVIALEQLGCIRIQRREERADRIFLHARDGSPLRFPAEGAVPYNPEQWAHDLAGHFPHIHVELDVI